MKKRVLLTGGHGFLGRRLQAELSRRDWCGELTAPRSKEYDFRDRNAALDCMKKCKPDIIIHAAAHCGGIGLNVAHPGQLFYDNVLMGAHALDTARECNVEKFVAVGTICSYPQNAPNPLREESIWDGMPAGATSAYGIAKRSLLAQCQAYRKEYDMRSAYVILTNLYGPEDNFSEENSHVVAALIKKFCDAKKNGEKSVTVWGDGSATREFLFVDDAARGIADAAASYDDPSPVNIGNGREVSIKELATKISSLAEFTGEIVWDTTKPGGQPRRCMDVSRAKTQFGFTANVSLEEGLSKTVEWYKSQQ